MAKLNVVFYHGTDHEIEELHELLEGRGYTCVEILDTDYLILDTCEYDGEIFAPETFKIKGRSRIYPAWVEYSFTGGSIYGHYTLDVPPKKPDTTRLQREWMWRINPDRRKDNHIFTDWNLTGT